MKHLHIECVGGASGDMLLGMLIDLGAPADAIAAALRPLDVGPFQLKVERAESRNITGTRVRVLVEGAEEAGEPAEPVEQHHHEHLEHDHAHHHDHAHAHDHGAVHAHRALSDIEAMIRAAGLPVKVEEAAIRVFRALGEAEARIHGVPVEHIHFHEVGAADSIIDIVGCCWGMDALGVDSVSVGTLPMGHGVIRCAHGVYPNPAPATLELMAGFPVVSTDEPYELVTPTGAALLSAWRNAGAPPPGAVVKRIGYSLGRRVLRHRPNVVRATLYELVEGGEEHDVCVMLECQLDDTTPELVGALMDEVLAAGALDVTCTPVTMKKQRPGMLVSVLCEPARRETLLDVLFRGTTTFGVREYPVARTKLVRRFETVATPYGEVRIKIGSRRGEDLTRAPEMADCLRLARERGVHVRVVYEAAIRAGR